MKNVVIRRTVSEDVRFVPKICQEVHSSALLRGTGIGERPESLYEKKISEGLGVIAINEGNDEVVGFCYLAVWDQGALVSHSSLIVFPAYRGLGISRLIKARAIELGQELYPHADIFGLTTSLTVMKVNSDLGYRPVTYEHLATDEDFWNQCKGCVNYDILQSKNRANCLCTGMKLDRRLIVSRSEAGINQSKKKAGQGSHS